MLAGISKVRVKLKLLCDAEESLFGDITENLVEFSPLCAALS